MMTCLGQAQIYVAGDGNDSTGASWATAYTNIQRALDAATNGSMIHVKAGEYVLARQIDWTNRSVSGVSLRGSYEGVGNPGRQDISRWPTILRPAAGAGCRILYMQDVSNAVLDQFVITGGTATNGITDFNDCGGGVCLFTNREVRIESCCISGNLARGAGGGIYMLHTYGAVISNCTIISNRVDSYADGRNGMGGGIYGRYSTCSGTLCLVAGNTVRGYPPWGGGAFWYQGTLTLERTTVSNNWLQGYGYRQGGGLVCYSAARIHLYNCVVSHNRCEGGTVCRGAGYFTDSCYASTIRNTLFYMNTADGPSGSQGGALFHYSGYPITIENCTVVENSPHGLYLSACSGNVCVTNSILWNNGDDLFDSPDDGTFVLSHNDIKDGDGFGTNGNLSADPMFRRPQQGDFMLGWYSPCRDIGTNLAWMIPGATDLAGNPRVVPASGIVDMGAYEGAPWPKKGTFVSVR